MGVDGQAALLFPDNSPGASRFDGTTVVTMAGDSLYLGSAFRQLLTLAAHLGAPGNGRPLIDLLLTVADLANYVAFTLDAAGVFDSPTTAGGREVPCHG